jgi:hypothetical protein
MSSMESCPSFWCGPYGIRADQDAANERKSNKRKLAAAEEEKQKATAHMAELATVFRAVANQ